MSNTQLSTDPAAEPVPQGAHDAEVDALFSADGTLAEGIPGFRPRQSQTDMAKAVASAIGTQGSLIA